MRSQIVIACSSHVSTIPTTTDLLVAGGLLLFYGGMLAGVKPVCGGISWEGHLFGLLAGLARAWLDTF